LLIVVCTILTDRFIEPRLGKYSGELPAESAQGLTAEESRGLWFALIGFLGVVGLLILLTLPAGAPLRSTYPEDVRGQSPFMDSLIFLIMLVFGTAGVAYGLGARTIKGPSDAIEAITKTFSDLGGLLFLFFVISQFVAYFNFSNMGTVLAVQLASMLKEADLGSVPLLLGFILIGFVLSIPIPNIIPKWAIVAPIFVPLFMKLGVEPDVVLAAYRVSDAPPNVINPLLPYFALVVVFARKYDKEAGVGTIVAMMLPYTVVTFVTWVILFFAWYMLGLPFGPS
jgi:aminobenzoyl-glutamate transport protein